MLVPPFGSERIGIAHEGCFLYATNTEQLEKNNTIKLNIFEVRTLETGKQ